LPRGTLLRALVVASGWNFSTYVLDSDADIFHLKQPDQNSFKFSQLIIVLTPVKWLDLNTILFVQTEVYRKIVYDHNFLQIGCNFSEVL
jgi:hypothetical protein